MDDNVLVFELYGKFAHFRKFYSNSSSLSYKIPPPTVIMGIIASILKESRDSYYEWLSPPNSYIGIKINKPSKSVFQCMNYVDKDYTRIQTRLELLTSINENISYNIYFFTKNKEKFDLFVEKIKNKKFGYGIYLGQRQFSGSIEFQDIYKIDNILYNNNITLSTLTYKDNIIELDNTDNKFNIDLMPISFLKDRIPDLKTQVLYEENGVNYNGKFIEIIKIKNNSKQEYISFFTPYNMVKFNENKSKITSR